MTESGPADGRPVLALHGWPQHHWAYRDLLADPPPGLRIIAPDLPGYGWSGPAPHKWAKEDVATDVLALLDALGLDRVLLVAHDCVAAAPVALLVSAGARLEGAAHFIIDERPGLVRARLIALAEETSA